MPSSEPTLGGTRALEFNPQLRAAGDNTSGREFGGIAVPWNTTIEIYGIREEFAPGSIEPSDPNYIPVCWRHDDPIGQVTGFRDDDTGWAIDARLSDTTLGRDAATLLVDGALQRMSIRFNPLEWEERHDPDTGTITYRYTRAVVSEVSLVPIPAYDTTTVDYVRSSPTHTPQGDQPMPPTQTEVDVPALAGDVDTLTRSVEQLRIDVAAGATRSEEHPLTQFRSFGEYVQAVASGNEAALRAYAGIVSGDVTDAADNSWVGDLIRRMTAKQIVAQAFTFTHDLPAKGMNVEFGREISDTTQVGTQANEGDDLLFGKLEFGTATAPVVTLGGWSSLSRQAIERSNRNVVSYLFDRLALRYARSLEVLARAAAQSLYTARSAAAINVAGFDADNTLGADDIVEMLLEVVERFDDNDLILDGIFVAKDIFRKLARVPESKKLLQITSAPTDKAGTLTISSLKANLSNINVQMFPGAANGLAFAYDASAIRVQDSPGAPFRLQDENIVNITKDFSIYGYAASYTQHADGLIPLTFGAEAPVDNE